MSLHSASKASSLSGVSEEPIDEYSPGQDWWRPSISSQCRRADKQKLVEENPHEVILCQWFSVGFSQEDHPVVTLDPLPKKGRD
jgi:hypothetical protein